MIREGARHAGAKRKLARWLSAMNKAFPSGSRVRLECPLTIDRLWHDLPEYAVRTPGIRELRRKGFQALLRFDVAVTAPGRIVVAFEVENAFPCTVQKAAMLETMPFETVEIDAAWIIAQRTSPASWEPGILRRFGGAA